MCTCDAVEILIHEATHHAMIVHLSIQDWVHLHTSVYSYIGRLKVWLLTSVSFILSFYPKMQTRVDQQVISGNQDFPEGGFDGFLQSIVCKKVIFIINLT